MQDVKKLTDPVCISRTGIDDEWVLMILEPRTMATNDGNGNKINSRNIFCYPQGNKSKFRNLFCYPGGNKSKSGNVFCYPEGNKLQ